MLGVIGVSTAIEYGLKGLYENTIGRLSELNFPDGGTAEDKYGKVARDYATLIATKGWYEFGFMNAFKGLWTQVPMTGPGMFRKWERRFALSAEYLVKAMYASVIGAGTAAGYTPDELTRYALAVGWSDSLAASDSLHAGFHAVRCWIAATRCSRCRATIRIATRCSRCRTMRIGCDWRRSTGPRSSR
jgi:hypothetical protein